MRSSSLSRTPSLEPLEERQLLANNVSAFVTRWGDLVVKGDAADNEIRVTQGASVDQYVIEGLHGTTINGGNRAVVGDVEDGLHFFLEGGNDYLGLIDLEAASDIYILGLEGDDDLQLTGVTIGGDLEVRLEGDDNIIVDRADIGETLHVLGGVGDQSLLIQDSAIAEQVSLPTRWDDDRVALLRNVIASDLGVLLGTGDDELWMESNQVLGRSLLDGGNGEGDAITPDVDANNQFAQEPVVPYFETNTPLVQDVVFGYTPGIGPDQWHLLTPAWLYSTVGRRQSAIDLSLDDSVSVGEAPLAFDYTFSSNLEFFNSGNNIEVGFQNHPDNSVTDADGTVFVLQQIHFHSASEHAIDGAHFPAEMHMVHQHQETGDALVVAVLLVEGTTPSGAWTELMTRLRADGLPTEVSLDPAELLPDADDYFAYSGSLTTPPNSEGVRWRVFQEPVGLSMIDLEAIRSSIASSATVGLFGNNRPIQETNSRIVLDV
ncbi:Carbonic anhydrase precursor [Planctomycetes bacterium Pan216]|uniref:Carbonic anhydrase n=1 Tax=Kolteria novifilia TaxID=2527975 RepID=A0A518BC28_9BACT|nr:Carbonic anhydrase precursor [Planctomycetes bacterium Pan216]